VGAQGGLSAGVGVLYRRWLNAQQLEHPLPTIPAERVKVMQFTSGPTTFLVATFYGWVDRPDFTHGAVHELICWLKTLQMPWVIGGDFNTMPSALLEGVGIPDVQVIAAGPTCFAGAPSCIDFFVCDRQFRGLVSSHGALITSLPTHRPVKLVFQVRPTEVPLLDHKWKTVATPQFGPAFEHPRAAATADALEGLRDQLTRRGGWVGSSHPVEHRGQWERFEALCIEWHEWARLEAAAQFATPTPGATLRPKQGIPTCPPHDNSHLKEAQLARWVRRRLLEARAAANTDKPWTFVIFGGLERLVTEKARTMTTQLVQVFAALAAEPDAGTSAAVLTGWIDWVDHHVKNHVNTQAAARARDQANILSEAYRLGQAKAYAKLRSFTFYQREVVQDEDGRPSSSSSAILASYRRTWAAHWGEGMPAHEEQAEAWRQWQVPTLGVYPPAVIRQVAASFKLRTAAIDGWHPRHFAHLSDASLRGLAALFHIVELMGAWPSSVSQQLTVLIPKAAGGLRPIALFRGMVRLFGKIAARASRRWMQGIHDPSVNTRGGVHVGDDTWRNLALRDSDQAWAHAAELQLDLVKAFDFVQRALMLLRAKSLQYPLAAAITSCLAHRFPRTIVFEGLAAPPILSTRGIAAGSAGATYELLALLLPAVRATQSAVPTARICLHVDDLNITATGTTHGEVLERLLEASTVIKDHCQRQCAMEFSDGKAFAMASDARLASEVKAAVLHAGGTIVTDVRRLGNDYSLRRPRQAAEQAPLPRKRVSTAVAQARKARYVKAGLPVVQQRLKEAARRARILRRQARQGGTAVFSGGILSVAQYGTEMAPLPPLALRQLRVQAAAATGVPPLGLAHELRVLAVPVRHDPGYRAVMMPLHRYHREVWMRYSPDPSQAPLSFPQLRALAATISSTVWVSQCGPVAAIRVALHTLGWALRDLATLVTGNGQELSLVQMSPAALQRVIALRFDELRHEPLYAKWRERHGQAGPLDPHTVHAILRSRTTTIPAKTAFLRWVSGTTPVRSWLAAHGWAVDPLCPHCSTADDTVEHALQCPGRLPAVNGPHDPYSWVCATPPGVPEDPLFPPGVANVFVNGDLVAHVPDLPDPTRPIFTDGSALRVGTPQGVAAAAAVYRAPAFEVAIVCRLDSWAPATSAAGEYWAAALAAILAGGRPTSIVTDSASVITSLSRPGFMHDPKGMHAGAWRHHQVQALVTGWHKVKSHVERSTAKAQGWVDFWEGNDRADYWAGRATASADSQELRALDLDRQRRARAAREGFRALAEIVDPALLRAPHVRHLAQQAAQVAKPKHAFLWVPHLKLWVCRQCERAKIHPVQPKLDKAACVPQELQVHPSHTLAQGWERGQNGLGTLFRFCTRCGLHATLRLRGLRQPCPGAATAYGRWCLRHIEELRVHPRTKVPLEAVHPVVGRGIKRGRSEPGTAAVAPVASVRRRIRGKTPSLVAHGGGIIDSSGDLAGPPLLRRRLTSKSSSRFAAAASESVSGQSSSSSAPPKEAAAAFAVSASPLHPEDGSEGRSSPSKKGRRLVPPPGSSLSPPQVGSETAAVGPVSSDLLARMCEEDQQLEAAAALAAGAYAGLDDPDLRWGL
jgi:ribonuclease HI